MHDFPSAAYDRWLTTDPRDADASAFETWCEIEDVEMDAPDAWDRFEAAQEAMREDWEEARAEERADFDRFG